MAETESSSKLSPQKEPSTEAPPSTRKQIRQPPSVPFIWEEKPGTPKRDWKPNSTRPVVPVAVAVPPPPVKLVASVPFKWEEKPGKALPIFSRPTGVAEAEVQLPIPGKALSCFSQAGPKVQLPLASSAPVKALPGFSQAKAEAESRLPPENPTGLTSSPLKPPPCMYRATPPETEEVPDPTKKPTTLASAHEKIRAFFSQPTAGAEVELSIDRPRTLPPPPGKTLPRFSQTTAEIAAQLPALSPPPGKALPWFSRPAGEDGYDDDDHESSGSESDESFCSAPSLPANFVLSTSEGEYNSGQLQMPDSPASESSYATGTTSLVGTSFLERLFPLLSPNLGFLEKQKIVSCAPMEVKNTDSEDKRNGSVAAATRPSTLGELIMMSRRRSCQRKAAQMRTENLSMEYMKKTASAVGCYIFGINNSNEGLQQKWKRQLRLKLV